MVATKPGEGNSMSTSTRPRSAGPGWGFRLLGSISAILLLISYQNCSVEMSRETPGASVTGFCTTLTAGDLATLTPALTALKTHCASCHSTDGGSPSAGFKVPAAADDVNSSTVQNEAHLNMCARGYSRVLSTIDPTSPKQHAGGKFLRSTSSVTPIYTWLETQL